MKITFALHLSFSSLKFFFLLFFLQSFSLPPHSRFHFHRDLFSIILNTNLPHIMAKFKHDFELVYHTGAYATTCKTHVWTRQRSHGTGGSEPLPTISLRWVILLGPPILPLLLPVPPFLDLILHLLYPTMLTNFLHLLNALLGAPPMFMIVQTVINSIKLSAILRLPLLIIPNL